MRGRVPRPLGERPDLVRKDVQSDEEADLLLSGRSLPVGASHLGDSRTSASCHSPLGIHTPHLSAVIRLVTIWMRWTTPVTVLRNGGLKTSARRPARMRSGSRRALRRSSTQIAAVFWPANRGARTSAALR